MNPLPGRPVLALWYLYPNGEPWMVGSGYTVKSLLAKAYAFRRERGRFWITHWKDVAHDE